MNPKMLSVFEYLCFQAGHADGELSGIYSDYPESYWTGYEKLRTWYVDGVIFYRNIMLSN